MSTPSVTTGNMGLHWRAEITPSGSLIPADASTPPLHWYVAADDRWHDPAAEPAVRQRRVSGTPVTETRLRVPRGDVVQRIYTTADAGGITVIEIENESTLAVAVAFDRRGVLTERPIADIPIDGIELPGEAFVLPLGHAAQLRIGVPHGAPRDGSLPAVPTMEQVVSGWLCIIERAGRYVLPDAATGAVESLFAARSELALGGLAWAVDDPEDYAIGLDQIVRMGERPHPWIEELADAVAAIGPRPGWHGDAALRAAKRVLLAADEGRAANDVAAILDRRTLEPAPVEPPIGCAGIAWHDEQLAFGGELLPSGIPESWLGQSFEAYDLPTIDDSSVGFGVRWHGPRPAVLWEQRGPTRRLVAPSVDPAWSTDDAAGEALWAAPTP